jgi:Putative phage tail protein
MSGKTISTSANRLDALTLQSSCYGACIPWAFGLCQVPGNLVWYDGFTAVAHTTTQGGKGGVKQKTTTYTYAADVLMDLCTGPITSITQVWKGKSVYSGGATGSQIVTVGENDTLASSGAMTYNVGHASAYVSMGNISFSYIANDGNTVTGTMRQGQDYTVAGQGNITVVNPVFHGACVTVYYQYRGSALATTALDDLGLTFIPGTIGQPAWSGLAAYGNASIGYSGQCQVAATQYDLGDQAQVDNHVFEVVGPYAYHLGSSTPDIDPNCFFHEFLTNTRQGVNWPPQMIDTNSNWSDYCVANNLLISPCLKEQQNAGDVLTLLAQLTNSEIVWSGGRLKMITYGDTANSGLGRTFTPDTTPIFDLDDDYFVAGGGGNNRPIGFELIPPAQRYNDVKVEYLDRDQQYAVAIAEAKDLSDIQANGLNTKEVIQAHGICQGGIARHVAQFIMQRSLHVLASYQFTLPPHYAILEPMDLVTLTDAELGLDKWPVRIKQITEQPNGELMILAEDYPAGVCSAALYSHQALGGYINNYAVAPGNIRTPHIWEVPPNQLPGGVAMELFVAARGENLASWGGCEVWVSMDGNNYENFGRMDGATRYGFLRSSVAGSLDFNFATPGSNWQTTSANAAQTLQTLCWIGGNTPEYIAYQNATLTGAEAYTLDGLVRGVYNTPVSAHGADDVIIRVDDAVMRSGPLDSSIIGQTLHFKFTSFNIYGQQMQSLADVNSYTYGVQGNGGGSGGTGIVANPRSISSANVVTYQGVSTTANAWLNYNNDGSITGHRAPPSAWFLPLTAGVGSSYWVKATVVAGNTPSGNTTGSWLAASGNLVWYDSVTGGPGTGKDTQLQVQVATDSGGTNIVSNAVHYITASIDSIV